MAELPMGIALVVCDSITIDEQLKKPSLIGIFNTVSTARFPFRLPELCVFTQLTNGNGIVEASLRCSCLKDNHKVMEVSGPLAFTDPNAVVELQFILRNLKFQQPGIYGFELLCDEQPVLESRFNVIHSQGAP